MSILKLEIEILDIYLSHLLIEETILDFIQWSKLCMEVVDVSYDNRATYPICMHCSRHVLWWHWTRSIQRIYMDTNLGPTISHNWEGLCDHLGRTGIFTLTSSYLHISTFWRWDLKGRPSWFIVIANWMRHSQFVLMVPTCLWELETSTISAHTYLPLHALLKVSTVKLKLQNSCRCDRCT